MNASVIEHAVMELFLEHGYCVQTDTLLDALRFQTLCEECELRLNNPRRQSGNFGPNLEYRTRIVFTMDSGLVNGYDDGQRYLSDRLFVDFPSFKFKIS